MPEGSDCESTYFIILVRERVLATCRSPLSWVILVPRFLLGRAYGVRSVLPKGYFLIQAGFPRGVASRLWGGCPFSVEWAAFVLVSGAWVRH